MAVWYPPQVPVGSDEWDPPAPAVFREDTRPVGWLQVDDVDPDAVFDPPEPPPPPIIVAGDE